MNHSDPRSAAYAHCRRLARSHYENFPVASLLLPRRLRDPVAAIYAFARLADDVADEGDEGDDQRLTALDAIASQLHHVATGGGSDNPIFQAIGATIEEHQLPLAPFDDLLSAFRQDVTQQRYASFEQLLDYCRRSANPIGRLLLLLNGTHDQLSHDQSDAICSTLQLINFLQDISQDYHESDRIYLPQDEMERFGVTEETIANGVSSPALRGLIDHQVVRCRQRLEQGSPLGNRLKGRFALQIRLTIESSRRVLELLDPTHQDLFDRPRLGRRDLWIIATRAFRLTAHG